MESRREREKRKEKRMKSGTTRDLNAESDRGARVGIKTGDWEWDDDDGKVKRETKISQYNNVNMKML